MLNIASNPRSNYTLLTKIYCKLLNLNGGEGGIRT
jgi:hypothetical protein